MTVLVKRSCNSNVHRAEEKLNFNAFTVVIDDYHKEMFDDVKDFYQTKYAGLTDPAVLETLIEMGLYYLKNFVIGGVKE